MGDDRDALPRREPRRGSVVSFYLSTAQADQVVRLAGAARKSVSGYVRDLVVISLAPRPPARDK